VFQMQRASNSITEPGEQLALQPAGPRAPSRAFRRSLMTFIALSSLPLGLGIAMSLPPARLAEALRVASDVRTYIIATAGSRFDLSQLPATDMPRPQSAGIARTALSVSGAQDRNALTFGDRLKVTFYESLGVTLAERGSSADQAVATIFPRMDLSGEYSLDEGGNVAIPKLGQFKAAGQTITSLQSALSAAFERAIGRSSDVHVAIVERQPIYVLGTVRNAGTFKHVPNMTVLQALANAGGVNSGIADTSKAIENIRETQRLRQTEARLDRLLINQARLMALRDDKDSLGLTASKDGLKTLVASAQVSLTVERARHQQQLSLAGRQVGIAQIELEAQNLRAGQLTSLLAKKSDRLRGLEGIAAHGSVSQLKLTDVGVDISETTARREDTRVALAQSERRLVEAEIALAKVQLDHAAGIDKELSAIEQEIDDCTQAIISMQAVTEVLRDSIPDVAGAPADVPFLRITRRVDDSLTVMPATEATALLPGDVVQVNYAGRVETQGATHSQHVTQLRN
jgi:polysaccharide biosynthesis/export protein ExoF